jgi:stage II sporulation SpoAA-like protein
VVERIDDMPAGTLGFRSDGELTDEDFRAHLAPALHEAVAAGAVRLLLVTPPDFGGADLKSIVDRARDDLEPGLGHRTDWKRIAIVTDSSWLRRSSRLWTRMVPVEAKVFATADEDEARRWLAAP